MTVNLRKILGVALPIILIVSFSLFINARMNKIADTDSFYHIQHAAIYKETGLLNNSFPWAQYSVVNKYSADIWYGFHMLLLPLTNFPDLLDGMEAGSIAITIIASLLFFLALLKLKVNWPYLWLFIFVFATADLMYRLTMLRPHPLSLGIVALIFAYLATENTKYSKVIICLLGAAFSWIHLSLSWVPILVAVILAMIQYFQKQDFDFRKYLSLALGLFIGLILRPNPLGAIKIAYIQVVQLMLEKQSNIPLRFGLELSPFRWENFVDQLIPITVLLILGIGCLWWIFKNNGGTFLGGKFKSDAIAALTLTGIFFLMTFGIARRSNELFIAFAVIFIALAFERFHEAYRRQDWIYYSAVTIAVIAMIYMPFKTMYRFDTYIPNAFDAYRMKDVATWLKNNAQPEEIVFNIHWDRFAQLFYWNSNNYYINGMDPIFEYAYDPSLYWKTHFLAIDAGTSFTCGKIKCTKEEVEPTVDVLKKDFHASYIVIQKLRSPKLYAYLSSAPEFRKVFEGDTDAVFKVL